MIKIIGTERGVDLFGSGAFHASRGRRTHNGIDIKCMAGNKACSNVAGVVTKLGYPYGDDLSYRYIEITDDNANRVRFFYVEPTVVNGQIIEVDDVIGVSQDLGRRYGGITNHVHLEVKQIDGSFVDPSEYFSY